MLPVRIEFLAVELLIAARRDQLAVGVEDHHRLGAAIEHVDAILRIDGEAGDAGLICRPRPAGRRALPVCPVARRAAACASRSAGGGGGVFKPKNSPGGSVGQFGTSRYPPSFCARTGARARLNAKAAAQESIGVVAYTLRA